MNPHPAHILIRRVLKNHPTQTQNQRYQLLQNLGLTLGEMGWDCGLVCRKVQSEEDPSLRIMIGVKADGIVFDDLNEGWDMLLSHVAKDMDQSFTFVYDEVPANFHYHQSTPDLRRMLEQEIWVMDQEKFKDTLSTEVSSEQAIPSLAKKM